MTVGQKILDEIIHQPMFRMECPAHPLAGCMAVWNGNAEEQIEAMVQEEAGYWKARALCVEDLLEAVMVWQETKEKSTRCEQVQSHVARLRRIFGREDTTMVCSELYPYGIHESWISVDERKPTLRTPIVEVMFNNFEIEESRFWTGYFEHNFLRFEASRPGYEITHWREKTEP